MGDRQYHTDKRRFSTLAIAPLMIVVMVTTIAGIAPEARAAGLIGQGPVLPPEVTTPENAGGESTADQAINSYLQDLLIRAVASHPSIAAARATIRASGADLDAARWQSFPSVSLEGMLLSQAGNRRQASLTVDQPIWAAGRIASSIKRAKADRQGAIAGYQETVLGIMIDLSQSYREYHRLDQRHSFLLHSLTEHRTLLETMERRVAREISPLADLELARSRTAQIEQQVATTAAQRAANLQKLRELVGDPGVAPGTPPDSADPPGAMDAGLMVEMALKFDPTRQRLVAEAAAASAQASAAQASLLPQLSGQYSYNETFGHRVGLVLRAQSDGGFSRFAAAGAARQREEAAELRISATERQLRERIISDLADYDSARDRMKSTRTARDAASRVTQSYMRQFVSGRRGWLDVMNAVREATSAENDAIDAASSAAATRDRLLMRSGNWPFPTNSGDMQ